MTFETPESPPAGPWLPRKAAAHYCGHTAGYFNKLASLGLGPDYVLRGGRTYYRVADLDRWMAGHAQPVDLAARRNRAPGDISENAKRLRKGRPNGAGDSPEDDIERSRR